MYTKTQWVDNTTPINENNLNKIEKGIYDNSLITEAIADKLNPTDTETYKTAELTEGQITDVIGVKDIIIKGQTEQDGTPTPSAPVDVNVVSGSNVINTSNKNLFDKDTEIKGKLIVTTTGAIQNNSVWNISQFIPVKSGTELCFSYQTQGNGQIELVEYDKNQNILGGEAPGITQKYTKTISNNTKFVRVGYRNDLTCDNLQLEYGSNRTTYEPHQGKELPLDLGSIELCKIGNYQDYFYKSGSKWYLHKEINKITSYNGETITTSYISTTGELSTGAKVYYVVNSTNTEITDTTLISQLEAIYNAPLYEETNITQTNNDLPMVLDITAYKDNINGIKAFIRK